MSDELVDKIADVIADHHESESNESAIDAAESAVALAESQAALANIQAAQVIAEGKSETEKLRECMECLTKENQETKAELVTIRSALESLQSKLSTPPPPPETVILAPPSEPLVNPPEAVNPLLPSGAEESPAPKIAPAKRRRRLI